jgi:hypothetical protein
VLLREPDFRGRDAVVVVFMRSGVVRENDDPLRFAKLFSAALCPPASSRRGPRKRTAHEESTLHPRLHCKYGLTICMATQRPRDIPDGVLSQMGTLIVHRLINDKDREVVERAADEIDLAAAAFLPTLAPGEAAIVGVDFPIPLTVQITMPEEKLRPQSEGPNFQKAWSTRPPEGKSKPDDTVEIDPDEIPF